jgi:copper chaperone NosL
MNTARHSSPRGLLAASILVAAAGLTACQQAGQKPPQPLEITRDTACSLDGMTVADFAGPKAQIFYEGRAAPDYFCDTIEMFAIYRRPEQKGLIRAVFVQDMTGLDWTNPRGHWIDARTAFYVAGSKRTGSMGATLASFATQASASAFAASEGGTVYRFDQVTPSMATLDGGVLKDKRM